MEICHFFRDICSNKFYTQHMKRLETNIIKTICKLEMIFSSSFFDSMEHLLIRLPFEEKVGGLVQYRLVYSFERLGITHASKLNMYCLFFSIQNIHLISCRYLFNLKRKVKKTRRMLMPQYIRLILLKRS
jgi:hypothetical protein